MKISPNQPVEFNDENINCQCDGEGSQLIQAGDVTQFQVELEVCNDMPNLILDGDLMRPTPLFTGMPINSLLEAMLQRVKRDITERLTNINLGARNVLLLR